MALDEALLRSPAPRPTLRTYTWDPSTLSLGYFQRIDRRRVEALIAPGYGLVRRSTGGGAIFHSRELTFSVICPLGDPRLPAKTLEAYEVVHGAVIRALAGLGVHAEFRGETVPISESDSPEEDFFCFYKSVAFDLVAGKRKLVGSAQRRTGRCFLMHGSIPVGVNSLTPKAAAVGAPPEEVARALATEMAVFAGAPLLEAEPTRAESDLAEEFEQTRFGCDAWTFRAVRE